MAKRGCCSVTVCLCVCVCVCVSSQDIAVGEELTFDYNFERYGDKPMPCYCGSRTFRRFIGGTQDTYDESMVRASVCTRVCVRVCVCMHM